MISAIFLQGKSVRGERNKHTFKISYKPATRRTVFVQLWVMFCIVKNKGNCDQRQRQQWRERGHYSKVYLLFHLLFLLLQLSSQDGHHLLVFLGLLVVSHSAQNREICVSFWMLLCQSSISDFYLSCQEIS